MAYKPKNAIHPMSSLPIAQDDISVHPAIILHIHSRIFCIFETQLFVILVYWYVMLTSLCQAFPHYSHTSHFRIFQPHSVGITPQHHKHHLFWKSPQYQLFPHPSHLTAASPLHHNRSPFIYK
jgi:hypothetical protein